MIFDENNQPVEQTGTGLNKPDGFGDIPERGGKTNVVKCSKCGQIVIYSADMIQSIPELRKCPKCGTELGTW